MQLQCEAERQFGQRVSLIVASSKLSRLISNREMSRERDAPKKTSPRKVVSTPWFTCARDISLIRPIYTTENWATEPSRNDFGPDIFSPFLSNQWLTFFHVNGEKHAIRTTYSTIPYPIFLLFSFKFRATLCLSDHKCNAPVMRTGSDQAETILK